jgi:hypothetical protein
MGALLVAAGLLWPWLKKTHLFHLPGGIVAAVRMGERQSGCQEAVRHAG